MIDQTMKIDLKTQDATAGSRGRRTTVLPFTRREIFETRVKPSRTIESAPSAAETGTFEDVNRNYELLEDFAEGGLGKLNLARDRVLRRFVAVKSLKNEFRDHPRISSDFISEAKITAQLDHPSIVPIYSLNNDSRNGLYFAMKLVNGRTMRECIDEAVVRYNLEGCDRHDEQKACSERLHWFLKVCEAVSFAHAHGVLHCDLKPDNVMIGEFGEVYVMDWGTAKVRAEVRTENIPAPDSSGDGNPGSTPKIDGTPSYIAPELLFGQPFSARTDVFALGMILFELVFLRPGVTGQSVREILSRIKAGDLETALHRFHSYRVPADLRAVVLKAVAADPEQRYGSVAELEADIKSYLLNEDVTARPDNFFRKAARWTFNNRMTAFALVMIVMFVSAAVTSASLFTQMKRERESRLREQALTTYQGAVAATAHKIDRNLLHLQDLLENMASKAAFLLESPRQYPGEIYEIRHFNPPDLQMSDAYRREVSIDYPGLIIPAGAEKQARALLPLRYTFQRMLGGSSLSGTPPKSRLIEAELPMKWTYLGLDNGLFISYPGKGGYPADYDPRLRPWYRMGREAMKTRWGKPYLDIAGMGLVLPCVAPIVSSGGRFYGVAGLDVTLDYIIREIMDGSSPWVRKAYILDGGGRIVVDSSELERKLTHQSIGNRALTLEEFPFRTVWEHIRQSGRGQLREGGQLFAFARIPVVDWYYVEEADWHRLIR